MPSSPLECHLVRGFGRGGFAPAAPVRQRTAKSGGRIDLVRLVWLSAGLAAVAIYALGPSPTVRAVLFDGLGLGAFAAMSYRAARSAPGVRRGWALASAALLLWFAADATSDAYMLAGNELAFPSVADPLYLAGYPFLVAAICQMGRRWTGGRYAATVVDAAMISLAFVVLVWAAAGGRMTGDAVEMYSFLALLAYPAMDLLVLAALIRVFSSPKRASTALRFLFIALVVQLLVDGIYAATALSYEIGRPLDAAWMLAYVLFGAAALTPPQTPGPPVAADDTLLGRRRLLIVGSATLLGPVGLLVAISSQGFQLHLAVLAGTSAALTLLVIGRLADMFRRSVALRATAEEARHRAEQAEHRVEREERRLRTIVEHSSDVVTIVGADLRVSWQGGSIRGVLGHDPDAIVGRSLLELVHPEEVAEVGGRLRELARTPDATAMLSLRILDADRRYREMEAVISNRLDDSDVEGLIVSIRDMPERRKDERLRERLEAQRERQQLEGELQRARRLESVGQLAGGVAHDFNNLLAVIVNCAVLAHDDLPDGPAKAEIASIQDAAERGARLVRQLLLFSQSKAGAPQLLDLNTVVQGMHGLLSHTLGPLHYEADTRPTIARADLSSIEQVLVNLVVNARDAAGAGGTIDIRTANVTIDLDESVELEVSPGEYVRISVTDDGCGMDADTLARACEPFFTTKAPGKGSGLGLATVHGVAQQAGGCVILQSHPGTGTTVHVHLPSATATADHPQPDPTVT